VRRVVLDTNVLAAALRSDQGASRRCVEAALDGRFELIVSIPLVLEYEAILTRPEQLAASGLSRAEVGEVLDGLVQVASRIRLDFLWRPMLRDADDEMVIETAMNGGAGLVITFNERNFVPAASAFGIEVVRPAVLLKLLEKDLA
jgi:putative PIN family toxin of toxin-antitoxin system